MKALFLWNHVSKTYIKSLLPYEFNYTLVVSNKELDVVNIQDYDQFVCLVELDWKNTIFEGYKLAESIVKKWNNELNPPNIQFCSFLKQEALFELNEEIYRFYSKSFAHNYLPLSKNLSFKKFSISKWRYLKHYALKKSGIISRFQHEISNLMLLSQDNLKKKVPLFRKELKQIENIVGKEAVGLYHQNYDKNLRDYLQELTQLLTNRKEVLEGKKNILKKSLSNEKLPKLMILEDNSSYANRMVKLLSGHFDIIHFNQGIEALEEIKQLSYHFSAAICDLELLKKNSKIDQEIQGIDVLEYIRSNCPHIVWRVITALPRKGIKELIDVDINRILHKNQLELYGDNEVIEKFILDIKEQIENNKFLLRMPGPKGRFWDATTKVGGPGGRFKIFYYDLKNSYPKLFSKMWEEIHHDWKEIIINKNEEIKVSTVFIKKQEEPNFIQNPRVSTAEKVEKLKTVIMHRILFFSHFEPGDRVVYKDQNMGYNKKDFWDGNIPASPKPYTGVLGIKVAELPTSTQAEKLTFKFKAYNELFPEENSVLKELQKIKGGIVSNFYQKHEDASETLSYIQYLISKDKSNPNSNFKGDYGNQIDNSFLINESIAKQICQALASERKPRSPSKIWRDVEKLLMDFKFGKDWEEEQPAYINFPFQNYINKFLE